MPDTILPGWEAQKILTDSWLPRNEDAQEVIHKATQDLAERIRFSYLDIPVDSHLVLNLKFNDENEEFDCEYYFVSHQSRILFWLQCRR